MKQTDNRRDFLRKLVAASSALVALPSTLSAVAAPAGVADERYWESIRAQFMIPRGKIMMNAANLCPSPYFVIDKVQNALTDLGKDVSFQFRDQYDDLRKESLKKLAAYLKVDVQEIGITRNTSESNNIIVNGLDLKAGDEVVLWDLNHDSNGISWENRARRVGFTIKKVSVPAQPRTVQDLIDPFARAITPRTKVLAFSHVSNTTGIALPAKALCKLARDKKVFCHVDGAQTFGFHDLDLHDLGCDSYSGSAHKWLMGPLENGVLYIAAERIPQVWPLVISAGWKAEHAEVDQKYCIVGQRNESTPYALPETVDFHLTIGPKVIQDRVIELNTRLKDQIRSRIPSATFVSPVDPALSGGIVIVNLQGKAPADVYQRLYRDYGVAGAGMAGVRLSPTIYNTFGEIDRVVSALAEISA